LQPATIEQWDVFELSLSGPSEGNPFTDVTFGAEFRFQHRVIPVDGFYDGTGIYRVRFMPDVQGSWQYVTHSSARELDGVEGSFICAAPSENNHGVVRVRDMFHFAYDDGTPFWQVGTTCYAWTHQNDVLEEQTLETLKGAPFNKLRMCVFPKHYAYNQNEPPEYPFETRSAGTWEWNFDRFNPAFFRHIEQRIIDLMKLGIEADLILFHPYDRWGFASMPPEVDDHYLGYVVARFAAYRNVWWSMANEWDLMPAKTVADWDRFLRIVQESDPYQHLRSIHNCHVLFDHAKPPITHVSLQVSNFNLNLEQIRDYLQWYRKPVVVDECCYEGDIQERWGNIPAQEMVRRFWEGTIHGAYVGHSETYWNEDEILWWSKGGVMRGQSAERIAFYRRILEETPAPGLTAVEGRTGGYFRYAGVPGAYYLTYTGAHQPRSIGFALAEGASYSVEVIDTWNMTITPVDGVFAGQFEISLPAKPYLAVRLRRCRTD
jgi:hypothetical protein